MKSKDKDKLITEWIKELRSNHYQQGVTFLCKNGKYCCLGVLCELAFKYSVISSRENFYYNPYSNDYYYLVFDGEACFLPKSLADEIFNGNCNPFIYKETTTLADLNDFTDYDFYRIAKIIEKAFKQKKLPYQMKRRK